MSALRTFRSRVGQAFPRGADFLWNLRYLFKPDRTQFGEARLLLNHLPDSGTYLELGAYQPVMYSNTFNLARKGWRGWAVDPEPRLRVQWKIFRPRTKFLNQAITTEPNPGSVVLHRFPRDIAVISTTSRNIADGRATDAGRSWSRLVVKAEFLPSLFDSFVATWGRGPTLLAMDCEGIDAELVQCMLSHVSTEDWPEFLLVEDYEGRMDQLLVERTWEILGAAGPSKLFRRRVKNNVLA